MNVVPMKVGSMVWCDQDDGQHGLVLANVYTVSLSYRTACAAAAAIAAASSAAAATASASARCVASCASSAKVRAFAALIWVVSTARLEAALAGPWPGAAPKAGPWTGPGLAAA